MIATMITRILMQLWIFGLYFIESLESFIHMRIIQAINFYDNKHKNNKLEAKNSTI